MVTLTGSPIVHDVLSPNHGSSTHMVLLVGQWQASALMMVVNHTMGNSPPKLCQPCKLP